MHRALPLSIITIVSIAFCNFSDARPAEKVPGWGPFPVITSDQLEEQLRAISDIEGLNVELFYTEDGAYYAVDPPVHAVENGARCLITDHNEIVRIASIVSTLRIPQAKAEWSGLQSNVEVRFWRADKPVLSALFEWKSTPVGDHVSTSSGLFNDHAAEFESGAVNEILKFAKAKMTGPTAGKGCAEFRK